MLSEYVFDHGKSRKCVKKNKKTMSLYNIHRKDVILQCMYTHWIDYSHSQFIRLKDTVNNFDWVNLQTGTSAQNVILSSNLSFNLQS